jgi:hypothetical protein
MRLVAALLLAVSLGFAQAPQGQPSEPPKKARIEGVVVSITGEPVPRAQVRLQGQLLVQGGQPVQPASFAVTSDDAGKFVIPDIDPGRNYQLSAQRPGFIPGRYGARTASGPATPLVLDGGQALTGLTITLTPQGVISGRITDVNGDPVQGAMVMLLRRMYTVAGRTLMPQNTNATNDQGEFRIANLVPDRYYLLVQDRAVMTGNAPAAQRVNIPTYYPNAEAGQEVRNLEIRLRQGRAFTVRGKAVTPDGAPIPPGTAVLAQQPNPGTVAVVSQLGLGQSTIRPEGTFEIRNLRSGSYVVQVAARTGGPTLTGRTDVIVSDADVNGVTIPLGPGATITGHMRLENGELNKVLPPPMNTNAVAGVPFRVDEASGGLAALGIRPGILLSERSGAQGLPARAAELKQDASFQVEGLGPVKYGLNVVALPQGMYVKSVIFNGTDVTHSEIDLSAGTGGTLEILLSNQAAEVTVSVRTDGNQPTSGRTVTLWPQTPDLGSPNGGLFNTVTDQNGSARFANVPPGIYYAAAWEDLPNGLQQSRDFQVLMTGDAFKLELKEGSKASADLQMIPVARIKAAEEKLP